MLSYTDSRLEIVRNAVFALFSGLYFSRLRHCALPCSADTLSFIRLHPNLVQLLVDPVPSNSLEFPTTFDPVRLPDLKIFKGLTNVAHAIIPGSPLLLATIFWDPQVELGAATLLKDIGIQLHQVENIVFTWDPMLLTAAAKYMAKLISFSVKNVSDLQVPAEFEAFFSCVDETLKALPTLLRLCIQAGPGTPNPGDLDWEFQTVLRWGDISPNLHYCILLSETKWLRSASNVWYPAGHIPNAAHTLTRCRWFLNTVITSSLPLAYTALL
ncbi:hypothetical protein C8F04DRAFT_1270883 [Mycena alexandri]|uniref:Uncharacterized protein n=1 Tax=Mycena alexandri TaxID=1745969 RepID=A0AAD6S9R6_9AGAR|nr:hypothetical protein C8F04DRAFT_1270883 [Mycena alexandri]